MFDFCILNVLVLFYSNKAILKGERNGHAKPASVTYNRKRWQ